MLNLIFLNYLQNISNSYNSLSFSEFNSIFVIFMNKYIERPDINKENLNHTI